LLLRSLPSARSLTALPGSEHVDYFIDTNPGRIVSGQGRARRAPLQIHVVISTTPERNGSTPLFFQSSGKRAGGSYPNRASRVEITPPNSDKRQEGVNRSPSPKSRP